jgi:hypothetical protein
MTTNIRLKRFYEIKTAADLNWELTFLKFKNKEASQEELVSAMQRCNDIEEEIYIVQYREKMDSTPSLSVKSTGAHPKGQYFYRIKDKKLFISDGQKYESLQPPYEIIRFEEI